MSADPASAYTIWLAVLCLLATASGIEIDGKLGMTGSPPEVPSSDAPEDHIPPATDTSAAIANPCPPNTRCLLLNLVLNPSTSLISLVPLVPVVKGKPVVTSLYPVSLVPVVKGKPVVTSLSPVSLVPVVKGKPVVPSLHRVPSVPVVNGNPVVPAVRRPLQQDRPRTKTKTLCCFVVRRHYDHLGHPCYTVLYPMLTTKPNQWTRLPTSTVGIYPTRSYPSGNYPVGSYPTRRYPAAKHPSGSYPVGSYPLGSYPVGSNPSGNYPVGSNPSGNYPVGSNPSGNYPVGRYPLGSYPVGSNPSGNYPVGSNPSGSYPVGSYPATHQAGGRRDWPRPSRPHKGGAGDASWKPLVPQSRPVVNVDGKLGVREDQTRETADARLDVKLDGRLGAFE